MCCSGMWLCSFLHRPRIYVRRPDDALWNQGIAGNQVAQTQTRTVECLVQLCPRGASDAQCYSGQQQTVISCKLQKSWGSNNKIIKKNNWWRQEKSKTWFWLLVFIHTWFHWRCPRSLEWGWIRWLLKVPSNPSCSMILWYVYQRIYLWARDIFTEGTQNEGAQFPAPFCHHVRKNLIVYTSLHAAELET